MNINYKFKFNTILPVFGFLFFSYVFSSYVFSNIVYANVPVDLLVNASGGTPTLAPMLEKVTPAVVNISTLGRVKQENPLFQDPFFKRFFNLPQRSPRRTQSQGSGVIIDASNGYILTNNHVIDKAEEIIVTLADKRELKAVLIGTDPETDVAVIQVNARDINEVPLANSDDLRVGDFVVAIGNPFGLGQTVTSGIVSALGRSGLGIEGYEDFIQTDASINPGNSGGALVNLRGELVGINTAIFSPGRSGNVGIGFAIPVNMARDVMQQLVLHGEVKRGRLGIMIQNLTSDLAQAFNIKNNLRGVVVASVEDGSSAENAGLKPGDIIVEVNNRKISNSSDLRNMIGLLRVGQNVALDIIRNGKKQLLVVEVTEPKIAKIDGAKISSLLEGATLGLIDVELQSGTRKAVIILHIKQGSAASQAGLRKGDIFRSVNRHDVRDFKALEKAVRYTSKGILLNIQRSDGAIFLLIQ